MKPFIHILSVCLGLMLTSFAKSQTAAADNKVSESITFQEPPKGPHIYGTFEGRSPCGIADQFRAGSSSGCDHLKWQIIFYRDTVTMKPTTYSLRNDMFNDPPLTGQWKITHGAKRDPSAVVYELNYGPGKSLFLLKGDENVLFILDEDRDFRNGDQDFSYTLSRVKKVLRPAPPK